MQAHQGFAVALDRRSASSARAVPALLSLTVVVLMAFGVSSAFAKETHVFKEAFGSSCGGKGRKGKHAHKHKSRGGR